MASGLSIETIPPGVRHRLVRPPFSPDNQLEEFIHLPHRLYRDDPQYVPLLDWEQGDLLDRRKHPFYQPSTLAGENHPGADAELFLARRGRRVVGRVAAIVNHIHNAVETRREGHLVRHGFFGFFDCEPDEEIAASLMDAAAAWLRDRGMTEIYGPASPSHNYYFGSRRVSLEPRPEPPRIFEAHNHDYYNDYYARWGMGVARRLFGYTVDFSDERARAFADRHAKGMLELREAFGVRIRPIDMRRFDEEFAQVNSLINRTLELNWGYSPMTAAELRYTAASLRPLVDPELILLAEVGGRPVGLALGAPDYNEVFRRMGGKLRHAYQFLRYRDLPPTRPLGPLLRPFQREHLKGARIIAMGVLPEISREGGSVRRQMMRLGPTLMYEVWTTGQRLGYREITASWVLEDNKAMNAPFQMVGKSPDRIWEIYQREI